VRDAENQLTLNSVPVVLDSMLDRAPSKPGQKEELPATLTVTRTSEEDFKQRQLIVHLDGQRLATLMFGDSVTRDVEAGAHRLRVSNTLVWKNVDFTLKPGEQAFFEVVNRTGRTTYPMLLIFGVGPLYVRVTRMM
jgi:hypothetical protein